MLEGLTPPKRERLCLVGEQSANLDAADLKVLNDALVDPRWSTNALAKALNARGFKVGNTLLGRHREKVCSCFKA
jgi:hypothetical protein